MAYVLIAPEMVIFWAARQHRGAKYFANRHQNRGWTMTHTFFASMGGFTLHDQQGIPLRILEPIELESLSEAGKIEWPSITEAEIQDRSKGDHLSKGIVLIQTSWFIIQCVVRGAYRLEVTELEVTTLAFAVLTGVIYYMWWNKPVDVRCSVPVYLLKDDDKEKVDSRDVPSAFSPVADPVDIPPTMSSDPPTMYSNLPNMSSDSILNWVDSRSSTISEEAQIPQQTPVVISKDDDKDSEMVDSQDMPSVSPVADPVDSPPIMSSDLILNRGHSRSSAIPEETQIPQQTPVDISNLEPEHSQSSYDNFRAPSTEEVQSTRMQQFSAFIQRQRQEHGTVLGFAHVFFLSPLRSFLSPFISMALSDSLDNSTPHRVPTFYSPRPTDYYFDWQSTAVAMIVSIVFGSIHCVAWSFHFPTLQEKSAWRISAASVAGLPILFLVITKLTFNIYVPPRGWRNIVHNVLRFMPLSLATSYVIARIFLLILPCIALRMLNPAALVDIQWTAFFPHIG